MKLFFAILGFIVLFPSVANAADNILCPHNGDGICTLIDNAGNKWKASVAFTTNGGGDIFTLGDVASSDNVIGVLNSSNRTLIDNSGTRWPAAVFYTTDGSGNVIPVPTGGGGGGVSAVTGTAPVVSSGGSTPAISMAAATNSVPGYLTAADHTSFAAKQTAIATANGFSASGADLSMTMYHDVYVTRTGTDASGCGVIANPCHTIGYVLANIVPLTGGSSTSVWTIHASDRNDAETGDILIPPYVFISCVGSDVAGYIRASGHSIKLGAGWTSNGRSGIQGCYISSTPIDLDFNSLGIGSAGSNFMIDDCFVTSTYTHTGRGVNGGDFEYIQNTFFFGAFSDESSELQAVNSTFSSSVTLTNTSTIPMDAVFFGGNVGGAFSMTESGGAEASLETSGTTYASSFNLSGTIALTADNNLPPGYSLGSGTTTTALVAKPVNNVYVDLLNGNDSGGMGTPQMPWKTMAHAFASISPNINEPITVHVSGGNNDTDSGTINMPPDTMIVADYDIQLAGNYVVGGSQNDTATITNITFLGTFTWSRNDGTEFSLALNNTNFFGAFDFEQAGSGRAATFLEASGYNTAFDGGITIQAGEAIFQSVGLITGTFDYKDSGSAYLYLSGADLYAAAIQLNGGITANFFGNFPEGGSTIVGATTGSGTPAIGLDSGSMQIANISGAFTLTNNVNSFLSQSASGSQPTCSATLRGLQWLIQGTTGVADTYQICEKNSSDAYVWVTH